MSFHVQEPALSPLDRWTVAGYTNNGVDNNPNPQTSGPTLATALPNEVALGIVFETTVENAPAPLVGYTALGSLRPVLTFAKVLAATGVQEFTANQQPGISATGAAWYIDCLPFKVGTPKVAGAAMLSDTASVIVGGAGFGTVPIHFGAAAIAAGDLLVVVAQCLTGPTSSVWTEVAGWTSWAVAAGSAGFLSLNFVAWKIADGTEALTTINWPVDHGDRYAFATLNLGQQAAPPGQPPGFGFGYGEGS